MKKIVWKILLIIGYIPFVVALVLGLDAAINGFSGLSFCCSYYGFQAFIDCIFLFSVVYFPTYIIGIILIVLSIIKLKKSLN